MKIQLSEHFTYKKLLKFTLPSIIMMIFTSIYSIVDGLFVSNVVGDTAFAAVNFIMPVIMILGSIGFMFGTGGSALIAKTMGEGENEKAQKLFSLFVFSAAAVGIVIGTLGIVFIRPLCSLMGADSSMLDDCVKYARILLASIPFYILQYEFQSFFITAGKPHIGLYVTIASGVTNMVLDALLVAVFPFGIEGAAIATAISQIIGSLFSIIYFARPNSSLLKLTKPYFDGKALVKVCVNGSSELMSNIAISIVSIIYNIKLLDIIGQDGVSAYGVLMYVNMIFLAIFIGYSTGIAPVVSFHFGMQNHNELKNLFKKSFLVIAVSSVAMFICGEVFSAPLSFIFVGNNRELLELTVSAFKIYSFSFLLSGISIFGSAFFTALNDGLTSALISFLRTLVFQIAAVLILSSILGVIGIWLSIVVAEVMSVIITFIFLFINRKKYNYL